MTVLYLTLDGLLEPLGTSQILRPILALSRLGFPYEVVSLEKARDLADGDRVAETRRELSSSGVLWHYAPYEEGGSASAVARNIASLLRLAMTAARRRRVRLVHARAHLPSAVAWILRRTLGTPYLFDFRGYWVDEQREQGRWVSRPTGYRVAKRGEAALIRGADAIVTLTNLARGDIETGLLGPSGPVATITTVADFSEFTHDGPIDRVPAWVRDRLLGKLTVAYVGAINASYATDASLQVFAELARLRADAHLLCLTRQESTLRSKIDAHGIHADRVTITSAPHRDMSHWLRLVAWGLLLLNAPYAKRGSMPTKLAELFASGVRPLQYGCNTEVSDWVRRAASGYVPASLHRPALLEAARFMAESPSSPSMLERARTLTAPHFSLAAGVDRYATLLESLGVERARVQGQ